MSMRPSDGSEFLLFSEADQAALNSSIVLRETRGKQVGYLACPVRGREVQAKPEERVRQLWLSKLINDLGYPVSRLAVEYPITFGRDSS